MLISVVCWLTSSTTFTLMRVFPGMRTKQSLMPLDAKNCSKISTFARPRYPVTAMSWPKSARNEATLTPLPLASNLIAWPRLTLPGRKLSTLTVWSIAGLSVTVAIFMNFAPQLPSFLNGYVGKAQCQTLRQVIICVYYQLWLTNWLKVRFDCKIEIIVPIACQVLRSYRYLIFQTLTRCFIRAEAFYNFQRRLEFLCQLI